MAHEIKPGNEPATQRDRELARWAAAANEAHEQVVGAARKAVEHALQAGRALVEAKRICLKGGWSAWVAGNFQGSARTAQGYMRLATHWPQVGGDAQRVAHLNLNYREVMRLLTGLTPSDGRANNGLRSNAKRLAAPEPAAQAESDRPDAASSPLPEPAEAPAPECGKRFAPVSELLRQAISELRRIVESSADDEPYARHLLLPLERICDAVATYSWVCETEDAIGDDF